MVGPRRANWHQTWHHDRAEAAAAQKAQELHKNCSVPCVLYCEQSWQTPVANGFKVVRPRRATWLHIRQHARAEATAARRAQEPRSNCEIPYILYNQALDTTMVLKFDTHWVKEGNLNPA